MEQSRIIVSDIFGRTEALEKLASDVPGCVEIFDPYNSEMMRFDTEDDAYSHFTSTVGLDAYTETLSEKIRALTGHVSLLGFSMGASAVWKLSNQPELGNISGAVLFYPSQIRHYTEMVPNFPVCLVLPEIETHFSVTELISKLIEKENVQVHRSSYRHGFMNADSKNYSAAAYNKYVQALYNVPFNKPIQLAI